VALSQNTGGKPPVAPVAARFYLPTGDSPAVLV
jgi:hypothetical protein